MLLSNSYFTISRINNALIRATNGHNPNAVYTLFIYFKSLFDYYSSSSNCKLIMDYFTFEKACIYKIENGRRIVKDFELSALAKVLNTTETELLKDFRKKLDNGTTDK